MVRNARKSIYGACKLRREYFAQELGHGREIGVVRISQCRSVDVAECGNIFVAPIAYKIGHYGFAREHGPFRHTDYRICDCP